MPTESLFPTLIHRGQLRQRDWSHFNRQLLQESLQLRLDDEAGRRWSKLNYPGGYTSYQSAHRLHQYSPTFAELEKRLRPHLRSFARSLELDLQDRTLAMTDCWVNIMPPLTAHSMHLHPLSTISGTYYVQTPRGCAGLKFEDPRLERFMAAPPRKADAVNRHWVVVPAQAGHLVLFESWLRHEVPPNPCPSERISISFNYNWF